MTKIARVRIMEYLKLELTHNDDLVEFHHR